MDKFSLNVFFLCLCAMTCLHCFADDLDDFLQDAGPSKDSLLIDLEQATGANFEVVDDLVRQEDFIEDLTFKPPRYKPPRAFTSPEPYTAQLKTGSILINLKTKKGFKVTKPLIVKAKEVISGSQRVFILDKKGESRYETLTRNAVNIEPTVSLNPKINPNLVYGDKNRFSSIDTEKKFSHFLSYHFESVRTDYYSTIFRGDKQSASSNTVGTKSYFLTDFYFQVGVNIHYNFGFWDDPTLGTLTFQGLYFGPSIMRSFWQKDESRWNLHISAFKSLLHESEKAPDRHSYSTIGLQGEIEKEFKTGYGPYTLGLSYRWSRSSVKETSEFLRNEALKGQVTAFGVYASYRFNWNL